MGFRELVRGAAGELPGLRGGMQGLSGRALGKRCRCVPQPCLPLPPALSGWSPDPPSALTLFPPSTTSLLIFFLGLQDVRFPQDEAVAPSSPFLEEDEGGKKDTWLAELAGERLMAATSCRSLRENPFKIVSPPPPLMVFLSQGQVLLTATCF